MSRDMLYLLKILIIGPFGDWQAAAVEKSKENEEGRRAGTEVQTEEFDGAG